MRKMKRIKPGEKKIKRRRILRAVFLVMTLAFLAGLVFRFFGFISQAKWDGRTRLNLALQAEVVSLASYSPSDERLTILVIPGQTFIEAIHGYGPYRAESIYPLGELEKKGGELLSGSLQEYLGIPVQAYAVFGDLAMRKNQPSETKKSLVKGIFGLLGKRSGQTSLTIWDLLRLGWKVKKVKPSRISIVNLEETSASSQVVLPDGSGAIRVDTDRVDRIVSRFFPDEHLKHEGLAVAVLNGTEHEGLARRAARVLENIGGRVVSVGEAAKTEECEVRSLAKHKDSDTVRRLKETFNCFWGGEALEEQRASVVLILGESYWQKLAMPF